MKVTIQKLRDRIRDDKDHCSLYLELVIFFFILTIGFLTSIEVSRNHQEPTTTEILKPKGPIR